jgi:hypothetical protein
MYETRKEPNFQNCIPNYSNQNDRTRDIHAMPPQAICDLYKVYQKMNNVSIDEDLNIVDFRRGLTEDQKRRIVPNDTVDAALIKEAGHAFVKVNGLASKEIEELRPKSCTIYEHKDFPGIGFTIDLDISRNLTAFFQDFDFCLHYSRQNYNAS